MKIQHFVLLVIFQNQFQIDVFFTINLKIVILSQLTSIHYPIMLYSLMFDIV